MPGCVSNSMLREGVFGYSRSPSRGFGRMKFCWSSSFECLQIEPNNPCGDEWNPLPLWSLALMHCFLRESLSTDSKTMLNVQNWRWCQSSTDLENWNINYYRTDTCQPVFSSEFEISPIFNALFISTGAKEPHFMSTAPPNPPFIFHWLNKQIFLHQCWRVGLGFSLY